MTLGVMYDYSNHFRQPPIHWYLLQIYCHGYLYFPEGIKAPKNCIIKRYLKFEAHKSLISDLMVASPLLLLLVLLNLLAFTSIYLLIEMHSCEPHKEKSTKINKI